MARKIKCELIQYVWLITADLLFYILDLVNTEFANACLSHRSADSPAQQYTIVKQYDTVEYSSI